MAKKLIVAHRGASNLAPENTIKAFQKAIEIGADMIELDVRKTRDGVLVAAHDPIYRGKLICDLGYQELSDLSQHQIPTLKEVLDLCRGKIKLNVELKEGGYENLVGEILTKNFVADDLLVTSFSAKNLAELKRLYPQIKIGLILGTYPHEWFGILKLIFVRKFSRQFDDLSLSYKHWAYKFYKLFPLKHHAVWVWTVDDPKMIRRLLQRPEITGIITNNPGLAINIANYGNPQ